LIFPLLFSDLRRDGFALIREKFESHEKRFLASFFCSLELVSIDLLYAIVDLRLELTRDFH
jgi:hypothetical protein